MCGIAGIWDPSGARLDPRAVERMLALLAHRGPDDAGLYAEGPLVLGHQRLAILDLSDAGHEPFLTPDGRGVLSYNGEAYNYRELRAELEKEGVSFRSECDAEVVLQALHTWGPELAVPRLDGMFGFAYFDARDGTLWLGRDRVGIKPLYVARRGEALAFASEIKALLELCWVGREPDMFSLAIQLTRGSLVGRRTAFRDVEALEPGSLWKVTSDGVEKRRYYDILMALDVERIVRAREDAPGTVVTAVEATLARSVRAHLASDVPLAAACSGGVDSSLLSALALRDRPELVGYVVAPAGERSDVDMALAVGKHLDLPIRQVELSHRGYAELVPEATWLNEHPLQFPGGVGLLALVRACHADGVKVLLTGEGADELFGGYDWYADVHKLWDRSRNSRRSRLRPWRRMEPTAVLFNPDAAPDRFYRSGMVALDAENEQRIRALLDHLEAIEPVADRLFLAFALDDLRWHMGAILQQHDRMGMSGSIELRVPFLENDVIDAGLHVSPSLKYRDKHTKWVLKQVAERHLPRDVIYAKKRGFAMHDEAFTLVADMVRGGPLPDLFRWSLAETDQLLAVAADDPTRRHHLTSLEVWARLFVAGESRASIGEQLVRAMVSEAA